MPENDRIETNKNLGADASQLIAEAHAAVLEQTRKNEFDAAPYERATELLESLPLTRFIDDRVQLALDITFATRTDYRPDLSRRALYAAFPSGGELKDKPSQAQMVHIYRHLGSSIWKRRACSSDANSSHLS